MNNHHTRQGTRGRALRRAALLGASLLGISLLAGGDAAAQTSMGTPLYEYTFWEMPSDGQGGTLDRKKGDGPRHQIGGELDRSYILPPPPPFATTLEHLTAYSNATATTFWTEALSPGTGLFPARDVPVGGTVELGIYQTFRKDDPDASLKFTISDLTIRALEIGGPINEGLTGVLGFAVTVYDITDVGRSGPLPVFDLFTHGTLLEGRRGDWKLQNSGPLNVDWEGGTRPTGSFATATLLAPYTQALNLSNVPVGDEFLLAYQMFATAIDTVQFDSRIQVYGRDPLEPASGSSFTFSGLTPTNNGFVPGTTGATAVPEWDSATLALSGLGMLLLAARVRRPDR